MSTSSVNLISSALDVTSIVDAIINVERAPVRTMESQVTSLQSKVSAYQSLNTKLSALSDKVNTLLYGTTEAPLTQQYSFADRLEDSVFAKCGVTSSDDNKISATASNPTSVGSYAITVSSLAQAKTMASAGFADATTTSTGTGTITITTGSSAPVIVTITSATSTLAGVRDAINKANAGVTATIINNGSSTNPYQLLITADDTGTANAFTITDGLTGGQALSLAQTQGALDAQFVINGVSITKSSNTISDVIDGVTFDLKEETANPVTLKVEKDVDSIVSALEEFVTAYNAVNSFINGQFAYNANTKKAGVLAGDSTLRRIQSSLQNQIIQSVSNQFTSYSVGSQVGLNFNRDGSLSLNKTKLQNALADDPTAVAALFLGNGTESGSATASDSRVTYNGKTTATQAGAYNIQVNTLAQKASAVGAQEVITLSGAETLTVAYGANSVDIALSAGDSLEIVLGKINSALSSGGIAATATNDGNNRIQISTNSYGSSQTITIESDGDGSSGTTGFGTTPVVGNGVDIAGTIGGNAALGNGLTLTGASGQPEEGLSVIISQTATGSYGTITIASDTEGVEGDSILMNLFSALDGITDSLSGPIHNATDGLNKNIQSINDRITEYEARLDARRLILTAQFSAADEALRLLTVSQANLTSQLNGIPK
jgi:flagellar hook-associated protein 2